MAGVDQGSYRSLRPGRLVVVEYRPEEGRDKDPRGPQPALSWAIYLGERFEEVGPRGWFGLPDGTVIGDNLVLWHFIPLGPSDHPEAQAAFLRRLRLRTHQLRAMHPSWFHGLPAGDDAGD
jgi:hypothetical protein